MQDLGLNASQMGFKFPTPFCLCMVACMKVVSNSSMSDSSGCVWPELDGLSFSDIDSRFPGEEYFIDFFTFYGFIPDRQTLDGIPCPRCGYNTHLERKVGTKLLYGVRCLKRKCNPNGLNPCLNCLQQQGSCLQSCRYSVNPLSGTIFEKTKLNFSDIFKVLFLFVSDVSNQELIEKVGVGGRAAVDWLSLCRKACGKRVKCLQIGGHGMTVEIGENKLYRKNNNQGKSSVTDRNWVVGGICKETNQCFVEICVRRDVANMRDIIFKRVAEGSVIITDSLDGYEGLNDALDELSGNFIMNYSPSIVETKHVNGTLECQENKIENLWHELKQEVKSVLESVNENGEVVQNAATYLFRFMYFRNLLSHIAKARIDLRFQHFLEDLRTVYPEIQRRQRQAKRKIRKE